MEDTPPPPLGHCTTKPDLSITRNVLEFDHHLYQFINIYAASNLQLHVFVTLRQSPTITTHKLEQRMNVATAQLPERYMAFTSASGSAFRKMTQYSIIRIIILSASTNYMYS